MVDGALKGTKELNMSRQLLGCAVAALVAAGAVGCNVAKDGNNASGGSCSIDGPSDGATTNDEGCLVLGPWQSPNVVSGAVTPDRPRCYSVPLEENGSMVFQISDFAANSVAMSLYGVKKDDGVLTEDELLKALPSRDGSVIEQLLPNGEHFLKINGNGSYTLTASFTPHGEAAPAEDPGANPDDRALTLDISEPTRVSGYTGPLDAADVYRFELTEAATVNIGFVDSLNAPLAGWSMSLYKAEPDDGIFAESEQIGVALARDNAPTFVKALTPGTYFIRVLGESLYTMVVSQAPVP
jgi:hypothetical protein